MKFTIAAVAFLWMYCSFGPCVFAEPPDYRSKAFTQIWYDGNAELASYDLTYPRYGEPRAGTAVAITVTEDFDWDHRVKHDGPAPGRENVKFKVVKLNLMEDFPTGVYDYNLMHSVFVAAEPVKHLKQGSVVKTTFSSLEWCGQAWQQAVWDADQRFNKPIVKVQSRSYFEGEADTDQTLKAPPAGFAEDAFFLWARKLAGPQPGAGETITVPILRSSAVSRLQHVPVAYDVAKLSIEPQGPTVSHEQLGDVKTYTATAVVRREATTQLFTGRAVAERTDTYIFTVEADAPHRVLRMQRSDGLDLTLVQAARLPYWQLNGPGAIEKLGELGLSPRPARTP
jgi:hypothetical protein